MKAIIINQEDLAEPTSQYFGAGVHEATITAVLAEKSNSGTPYLEFAVAKGEAEGSAKLYLSEGALKYTIDRIRKIAVHNTDEDKKDATRELFNSIKNAADLYSIAKKLEGKQCWYTVKKTDETYVNKDGDVKYRYETNIWGYEPTLKEKETSEPTAEDIDGEEINLDEIPF